MTKVYTAFDPEHFTSTEIFAKTMALVTRHHGKKNTTQGMDHAFMTVAVLINAREKDEFLKDPTKFIENAYDKSKATGDFKLTKKR